MTGPGERPRGFRRHSGRESADNRRDAVGRESDADRGAVGQGDRNAPDPRPQKRSGTGRDRPGTADSSRDDRTGRRAQDSKPGSSGRNGTGRKPDDSRGRGDSAASEQRQPGSGGGSGDRRKDTGYRGKSSRSGAERPEYRSKASDRSDGQGLRGDFAAGERPGRDRSAPGDRRREPGYSGKSSRERPGHRAEGPGRGAGRGRGAGSAAGARPGRDRSVGSMQGDRRGDIGPDGKPSRSGGERTGYPNEGPARREGRGRGPDDRGTGGRGGSEDGPRSAGRRDMGAGRRADTSARSFGSRAAGGGDRRGANGPSRRDDAYRRSGAGSRTSGPGKGSGAGRTRPGRGESPERRAKDPARTVALETLRAVRERDAYANLVLPAFLREYSVQGRDAALATELGYGACRSLGVLDAVIAECAGRAVTEIDGPLLDVLRLGTYQLLRTRVEPHAAVHTAVELARAESGASRAGFVNAVLRRVAERTPEDWVARLAPPDPIGRLAFEYAHPEWVAQAFADALGADAGELRDLLAADDARPVVHLVARPGDITAEELALVTGGEEGRWSPYAVYLEGGDPGALEPVREGMAAVQDEGSQLVALALTRAPLHGSDNGRWLDLCAGPGGKTALLGALAGIDGYRVDAVEPAAHRAELVRSATRGMPVEVHIADGRDSGLSAGYDRILVDAPCTGLGALRRRPEARWRRTPGDIPDLVTLQRELVAAAWELLRPGGVLVYSTCSPHLPETVAVVTDTVRRTGAEQLDARELLPGVTGLGPGPTVQLWPHRHGTDAMFVAALRKPR